MTRRVLSAEFPLTHFHNQRRQLGWRNPKLQTEFEALKHTAQRMDSAETYPIIAIDWLLHFVHWRTLQAFPLAQTLWRLVDGQQQLAEAHFALSTTLLLLGYSQQAVKHAERGMAHVAQVGVDSVWELDLGVYLTAWGALCLRMVGDIERSSDWLHQAHVLAADAPSDDLAIIEAVIACLRADWIDTSPAMQRNGIILSFDTLHATLVAT